MDKKLKFAFFFLVLFGVVAIGLLFFYGEGVIVLNPKGVIGEKERDLLILSTWIMLLIVIPVFILTFFIAWRYRANRQKADYHPEWDRSHLAEALWWGVPLVMIIALSFITWKACHDLDPFKPMQSEVQPLRVQVVALQWKWLFIYPEQQIASLNFLQIPEQRPIAFEITSDAPMNSFWIPELGGQIYAMAGMTSKLTLVANGVGSYRGFSSNISGRGFAGMTFQVQSSSQEDFEQWAGSVRQSPGLDRAAYLELVEPSEYVPPATYTLADGTLFDWVVMKYMMPGEMDHGD